MKKIIYIITLFVYAAYGQVTFDQSIFNNEYILSNVEVYDIDVSIPNLGLGGIDGLGQNLRLKNYDGLDELYAEVRLNPDVLDPYFYNESYCLSVFIILVDVFDLELTPVELARVEMLYDFYNNRSYYESTGLIYYSDISLLMSKVWPDDLKLSSMNRIKSRIEELMNQ